MFKAVWLSFFLISLASAKDLRLVGKVVSGPLPKQIRVASVLTTVDDSSMLVKCSFMDTTRTLLSGNISQGIEAKSYLTNGNSKGKVKPAIAHWPQMFELDMHKVELLLVFSRLEVEKELGYSNGFVLHLDGIGQKHELIIRFR